MYSYFMNYSFSGFGQGWQTPSLAIVLSGQDLQNLRLEDGTLPGEHFLHESSNNNISSTWQVTQERLT